MARRFRSYLNHFEVEMKEKGKGTFKSYINISDDEEEEDEEIEKNASEFFDGKDVTPNLYTGEYVIASARSVLKYQPFSNRKHGTTGHLFVTNYRICFASADRSSYDSEEGGASLQLHRNKLFGEDDIPLCNIDSVFQVSEGKKKKLTLGGTVSNPSKNLDVHCKDFRIHTFGFKFTKDSENKMVTNAIMYHSSPRRKSDLLFAYTAKFTPCRCEVPMFECREDWDRELERLECQSRWITTDANKEYHLSINLPEWFVVPACLTNNDLIKASPQFSGNRIPTWAYTHRNGSCLVRMSELLPETDLRHVEDKMMEAVKQASNNATLKRIDLAKACPGIVDIQFSHVKLRELCMTDSEKQFWHQDVTFFRDLEATQWLFHIQKCLRVTELIVQDMSSNQVTIIIREETSYDLCPLVSCLVQLCLDDHCRTQLGFEKLVQREWVALGHPFQKRLGLSITSETDQSPVFLLFLDCVWQLLQQFPASFAFTETYLTRVWDAATSGLFKTFVFNNYHQRPFNSSELLVAWDWRQQLSQQDIVLFNNPLYLSNPKFNLTDVIKAARSSLKRAGHCQPERLYAMKLTGAYSVDKQPFFQDKASVLRPCTLIPLLRLWTQCYVRWSVPAQIVGGGGPCEYLQQCLMVEEVMCLQHRLSLLQARGSQGRMPRPKSDLIFSFDGITTSAQLEGSQVTSSYPFSPGPVSETPKHSLLAYLEQSDIEYEYTDAED